MQKSKKMSQRKENADSAWETLQLKRLLFAVALFLAVFAGKKIFPQQMIAVGEEVIQVLSRSTDFESVFSDLGHSMMQAGGALDGLETFCIEVFGAKSAITEEACAQNTVMPTLPEIHAGLLTEEMGLCLLSETEEPTANEPIERPVGTILSVGKVPENGLPDGYTVDELSFGALDVMAPVQGYLNSGYGYRDHPVNGKYTFHSGTDISANAGDPIRAFADGVVEFVGEDDSYGLYLQLDHGDGIKSFYAHCQSVCTEKGQCVVMGETIAKVGATGRATGPHLHFELKCGEVRVDPAYYIDFLCRD